MKINLKSSCYFIWRLGDYSMNQLKASEVVHVEIKQQLKCLLTTGLRYVTEDVCGISLLGPYNETFLTPIMT